MDKVLITTSSFGVYDPTVVNELEQGGYVLVFNPYGRKLTESEVLNLVKEFSPVAILAGVEPLTSAVMDAAPGLKTIARCGIGMDSVDMRAAEERSISVTNTPDGPTVAVAELVLGAILTLLRGIHRTDASIRAGKWERPFGQLLSGKTVGLVGCGRIGSRLARLCSNFGCRVLGADPVSSLGETGEMVDLAYLLGRSDIVSLHLPYGPDVHHLIDETRIRSMRPGALLVNASRGGLVDEAALVRALEDGHLGGAIVDTYEQEPYTGPLKGFENTVLTAHIGSYARECRIMMERQAVANLLEQLDEQH